MDFENRVDRHDEQGADAGKIPVAVIKGGGAFDPEGVGLSAEGEAEREGLFTPMEKKPAVGKQPVVDLFKLDQAEPGAGMGLGIEPAKHFPVAPGVAGGEGGEIEGELGCGNGTRLGIPCDRGLKGRDRCLEAVAGGTDLREKAGIG